MRLDDYNFNTSYCKKDVDVYEAFYSKCMSCSTHYDRITGYFGSTIYYIIWPSLKEFIRNNGRIRLICSPVLSDNDINALKEGYNLKNSYNESISNTLNEMLMDSKIEKPTKALAYLIATGIVEVKIGVYIPDTNSDIERLVHDKTGIFYDDYGNIVGFRGSVNETFAGLSKYGNSESFDVYPNWEDTRDTNRCMKDFNSFDEIWNGNCSAIKLYEVSKTPFENLAEKISKAEWEILLDEITVTNEEEVVPRWYAEKKGRSIRKHQKDALCNWEDNNRRGLMEMATGSGKTFIGLCAIRDAINRGDIPIVFVPSNLLFQNWKDELRKMFTDEDIFELLCGSGNKKWKENNLLHKFTSGFSSKKRYLICEIDAVIRNDYFINNLDKSSKYLFIFDECHSVGSLKRRKILEFNSNYRLGLSATPLRYNDPAGNEAIINYFDRVIEPRFTLYDAIKEHILTEYVYYPCVIRLSENDQNKWNLISKKISIYISREISKERSFKEIMNDTFIQQKFIQRARIIKRAEGKVDKAVEIIRNKYKNGQKWIVYCDSQYQVNELIKRLSQYKEIILTEYHTNIQGSMKETLDYFKEFGGVLVSIKCLDEGVDIPSVTHALILASSKNPREFIQRRGRILRCCERKNYAYLYDMIVTPNPFMLHEDDKSVSIVISELSRAKEFATHAKNSDECINNINQIVDTFGINNIEEYAGGGIEDELC